MGASRTLLAAIVPHAAAGLAAFGSLRLRYGVPRSGFDRGPCDAWPGAATLALLAVLWLGAAVGGLAVGVQRALLWRTVARVRLPAGRAVLAAFGAAERTSLAGWSRETLRARLRHGRSRCPPVAASQPAPRVIAEGRRVRLG